RLPAGVSRFSEKCSNSADGPSRFIATWELMSHKAVWMCSLGYAAPPCMLWKLPFKVAYQAAPRAFSKIPGTPAPGSGRLHGKATRFCGRVRAAPALNWPWKGFWNRLDALLALLRKAVPGSELLPAVQLRYVSYGIREPDSARHRDS